jgi:hypothetical protein
MSKKREFKPEIRANILQNEVTMLKQKFDEMERDNHPTVKRMQRSFDLYWKKDLTSFASKGELRDQKSEACALDPPHQIFSTVSNYGTNVMKSMEEWRWNVQFQTLVHQMQALENKLSAVTKEEKKENPKQKQQQELPMQQKMIEELVRSAIEKHAPRVESRVRREQQRARPARDAAFSNARERDVSMRLKKVVLEMDRQASELRSVKEELRAAQDKLELTCNDVNAFDQSVLDKNHEVKIAAELQSVKEELRAIKEQASLTKIDAADVDFEDKINSELQERRALKEEVWSANPETTTVSVLGKDPEAILTAELQYVKEELRAIQVKALLIQTEPPKVDIEEKINAKLQALKGEMREIRKEAWLANTKAATVKVLGNNIEARMTAELKSLKEELCVIKEQTRSTDMATTNAELEKRINVDLQVGDDDIQVVKVAARLANTETTNLAVQDEAARLGTDLDKQTQLQKKKLRATNEGLRLTKMKTNLTATLVETMNAELQAMKGEMRVINENTRWANTLAANGTVQDEAAKNGKLLDDKLNAFWEKASKLEEHLGEEFQKQEHRLQTLMDECGTIFKDAMSNMVETWDVQFEELLQFVHLNLQDHSSTSRELQRTIEALQDQHAKLQLKLEAVSSTLDKKIKLSLEWAQQPVTDEQRAHQELRSQVEEDFQTVKDANEKTHAMMNQKAMQFQAEFDCLVKKVRLQLDLVLTLNGEILKERNERIHEEEERKATLHASESQTHYLDHKVKQQTKALKAAQESCKQAWSERDAAKNELKTVVGLYSEDGSKLNATTEQLQLSRSDCASLFLVNLDKRKGQLREMLIFNEDLRQDGSVVESGDVSNDDFVAESRDDSNGDITN